MFPLPRISMPALAKVANLPPQFQMLFETAPFVQTQLKRGHVGLRIHVAQHAPRPVIESPAFIFHNLWIAGDFRCLFWRSRRGILHLVERLGESVKIMDGGRMLRLQRLRARRHPMRRHYAHGLGPRQARRPECSVTR